MAPVCRLGEIMFNDAFSFFSQRSEITGIFGEWLNKPSIYGQIGGKSIDFVKFEEALAKGMTKEQAAL